MVMLWLNTPCYDPHKTNYLSKRINVSSSSGEQEEEEKEEEIHGILHQLQDLYRLDRNLIRGTLENNYCILRGVIIGRDMIERVHAY